jgi:hypothetical protein
MATLLYKDHLIVASADCNPADNEWIPMVTISWKNDGHQELHTLASPPNRFASRWEAEASGIEKGKTWIDSHTSPRV